MLLYNTKEHAFKTFGWHFQFFCFFCCNQSPEEEKRGKKQEEKLDICI